LRKIDDAIDTNADLADAILATGLEAFGLPENPHEKDPRNWHGKATPNDVGKASSTIRQFYRDWSAEGIEERKVCYEPVLNDLLEFTDGRSPTGFKVLIPGAGLGRLVFDLCMAGFSAEGNEISYHQLMASSWVLNHTQDKEECALYPFALHFSNMRSRAQQLTKVMIPDVHPGTAMAERRAAAASGDETPLGEMSMSAADFLVLYGCESQKEAFDAVATVFFIDTAPNLIRYIETIHNCLKPGGIWINIGPLLWHFEGRSAGGESGKAAHVNADEDFQGIGEPGTVELTEEEVFQLVESMGFKIQKHDMQVGECGYIQDPLSMLQNLYRPSHWVAIKE
jgi:SAM-dependent methyltransferase